MGKLSMCRICLVENVRMCVVTNKSLQETYERLADVPFVTEDRKPMLACLFCCTRLKQCCQLQRQCVAAEELLAQMLSEDYEQKHLTDRGHLGIISRFIITPILHITTVDDCQIVSDAIKQEPPDVCEEQGDVELQPTQPSEEAAVATKPTLKRKLEDTVPAKETVNVPSDSKIIRTTETSTSESVAKIKEPITTTSQSSFNQSSNTLIHTGEKLFKCEVCQHSFATKSNLNSHFRIHTGEKSHKCNICQRTFYKKSNLNSHLRIHTGEKPFKCEVCQRSFSDKSNLDRHFRIHTGEKLYKCDVCQYSYSQKSSLKVHSRLHTGEKPFKCDVCQHSFNRRSNLNIHFKIHSGEKPYKCDVCQRNFLHKSSLKVHSRVHLQMSPQ